MKLTIKVLQGSEFEIQVRINRGNTCYKSPTFICTLQTEDTALISDVKREIARVCPAYPVEYQKLLSNGRTLLDDKSLEFYKIKELSKLMLVIKKPEPLKEVLLKQLRKSYSEDMADKIVKEFLVDFDEKMKELSLDDLERLSASILVK